MNSGDSEQKFLMSSATQIIENELVIAFVAAVGVNLSIAEEALQKKLEQVGYSVDVIKIGSGFFPVKTLKSIGAG